MRHLSISVPLLGCVFAISSACSYSNTGTPGNSAVSRPAMQGTVFTIVFENHDEGAVLNSSMPYLSELASTYGRAEAYTGNTHPSLPNYLQLTSGSTFGVADDNAPAVHPIASNDNLGDQLDAAQIPWRAYMESMGEPCVPTDSGDYSVHHNPWVYYTSMSSDAERCRERVVDFDQHFAADLAADSYRYMWISPNMCNDMHNCSPQTSDAWLQRVVPQIMASPGYQNGGAIFILFDEGSLNLSYLLRTQQNLATVVISPNLVSPGYRSSTSYNHLSYLATIEDMFGLPRLPTTASATPMADFFAASTTEQQ